MRPRLWDEQTIPEDQWNYQIKQPIREAFKTFILVMRQFPTKINKQHELVAYTLQTILPNCEAGISERGLRYELSVKSIRPTCACKAGQCLGHKHSSIWEHDESDVKIALGYHNNALRLPSDSPKAKEAMDKYTTMLRKASRSIQKAKPIRTAKKSQLQTSLPLIKEPEKDFSWVKTDAFRVINKVDFETPDRPHTAYELVKDRSIEYTEGPSRITDNSFAVSSSTLFSSDEESEIIIPTSAISYRPVLSAKQKELIETGACSGPEAVSKCLTRSVTGYPFVHSRRRRGVKSASALERQLPKSAKATLTPI
ncbi:uncharacterized protein [Watersipora subatra]|uniref:uncharacterized protein n=1 Tax=Watersipora subatra TaxID=2589382 RepID=UPI00355C8B5C